MDKFLPFFQEIRDQQRFFDGILESDDGHRIPIHRVALGFGMNYFKDLFKDSENDEEHVGDEQEIYHIKDVTSDQLELIVDFCYRGKINLMSSNIEDVLKLARQFLIDELVAECCEWLKEQMFAHNCIRNLRLAELYQNEPLRIASRKYMLKNFHQVAAHNDEFLTLNASELVDLIHSDELGIGDEMQAVDAIFRWIHHDPTNRSLYLVDLLKKVRLGLVSVNELLLKIQRSSAAIELNDDCSQFLNQISEDLKNTPMEVDGNNYFTRPRMPYEIPFVIGGWTSGYPTNFVETFDVRAKRWSYVVNVDISARAYHRLETIAGLVYMIGGFDGTQYYNSVRCYDPVAKTWVDKSPMHHHRCYVSSCVLNGNLYAFGGFDGAVRLDSAEKYDPSTNQWTLIAPMRRHRSDASAAACNGKAYIVGGFTGEEVLSSAEFYDPESNVWTLIASMSSPRSGVSMVTYDNCLYVLGGFNGFTRLRTAEKFNFYENHWVPVGDMLSPRSNFTAVVLEGAIFVIGGFDGTSTVSLVESYDKTTDSWNPSTSMNVNRSALCACVLENLPNGQDYSYLSYFQPNIQVT